MASKNSNLARAKKAKDDEFYTRRTDIEQELRFYKNHFKDKVVYLNCDDPAESEFWQYFVRQFNAWELKGLIATHYDPEKENYTYTLELNREYVDINLNVVPQALIEKKPLECNGDFRSSSCIEILKRADIVVTNPPFSLFREYIAQLIEYDKKFLVLGNKNSFTYKEIFPLIKEGKIWIGYTSPKSFMRPDGTEKNMAGLCRWFTNLDIPKRHESLDLRGNYYNPKDYPKYDNYDAIEVSRVCMIPCDYDGVMGVPITYIDQHNPDDFEILGITLGNTCDYQMTQIYKNAKQHNKDGSVQGGSKVNTRASILTKEEPKGKIFYTAEGVDGYLLSVYPRILIKNKLPQPPHKEEEE